jgi:hypothetical protein
VLFISGGYDTAYDGFDASDPDAATWLADLAGTTTGNAIFMVDRSSGALLWTAARTEDQVDSSSKGFSTFSEMKHSFPTEPTVVDADFDGVADLLFATDIAGHIWRFDFRGNVHTNSLKEVFVDTNDIHLGNNNYVLSTIPFPKETETDATSSYYGAEVSGGIIADLSEYGVNRLFYNKLDVSLSPRTDNDLARYNIVTGSGYRASPLLDEGFNNRLYFVFDRNIQAPKVVDTDQDGYPDQVSYDYVTTVEYSESELSDVDGTIVSDIGGLISTVFDDTEYSESGDATVSDYSEYVTHSRVAATDLSAKNNSITLDTVGTHKHGFFINLATGTKEKMINPTLTNDGIVLAVSYSPTSVVNNAGGDICEKNIGSSSLYQVDLYTGEAARLDLAKAGISTKPIVIEVDNDDDADNDSGTVKVLIIGSESFDGSEDLETNDGDIDELVNPGLNDSNVGKVIKVNWWERRN